VVHEAWTESTDFPLQNKSEKPKFNISDILHLGPSIF
jgi:hypothetical protein